MTIRILGSSAEDTKEFHNVSLVFDYEDYNILVTYTVDGEPSAPLYTRRGASFSDITNYVADSIGGTIQNIRLWRLLHEHGA